MSDDRDELQTPAFWLTPTQVTDRWVKKLMRSDLRKRRGP